MIVTLWKIFRASQVLQGLVAVGLGFLAFKGWQIKERQIGARVAVEKIEKKADANAKQADEVRDAVAAAKPTDRVRAKYERGADQ